MVLLRGLFGAGLSYLPTAINMLQLLGWSIFELVTIATAAHIVAPALPKVGLRADRRGDHRRVRDPSAGRDPRAAPVRDGGGVRRPACTCWSSWPAIPLPAFNHGTWSGYWAATDTVVAVAISFAPMAADYMRHARSERSAFSGAMIGYSITQILCYVIGLLALVTVARSPNDIYGAFIALPLGAVAFAVLAARELDQSFADVYSTAVSTQNLRPLWDRRIIAGLITGLATVLALFLNIADYENFLVLLGSVFVPMFAVLAVDFFLLSRGRWDLSAHARSRWLMLLPWAAGLRHLPAHQPRLRLLVGLGVDQAEPPDRLHPRELDVRVDLLLRRRRGGHPARLPAVRARPACGVPGAAAIPSAPDEHGRRRDRAGQQARRPRPGCGTRTAWRRIRTAAGAGTTSCGSSPRTSPATTPHRTRRTGH